MLPGNLREAVMQLDSRPTPGDSGWQTPIAPLLRCYVLRLVNLMCAFGVPPIRESIKIVNARGMDCPSRVVSMEVDLQGKGRAEVIVYEVGDIGIIAHQADGCSTRRPTGNDAILLTVSFLLKLLRHCVLGSHLVLVDGRSADQSYNPADTPH